MEDSDRIERLLALILVGQMQGATQREKVLKLSLAGFTNVEIADILQMAAPNVSKALHEVPKVKIRKN